MTNKQIKNSSFDFFNVLKSSRFIAQPCTIPNNMEAGLHTHVYFACVYFRYASEEVLKSSHIHMKINDKHEWYLCT